MIAVDPYRFGLCLSSHCTIAEWNCL